jgi:hypothetical protein
VPRTPPATKAPRGSVMDALETLESRRKRKGPAGVPAKVRRGAGLDLDKIR